MALVEPQVEVQAKYATIEDSIALSVKTRPLSDKWVINLGAANQMIYDVEKLFHKMEYKGSWMVIIADNTRLTIKWIGDTMIVICMNPHKVELQNVMYVKGIKKNLLSVS